VTVGKKRDAAVGIFRRHDFTETAADGKIIGQWSNSSGAR